MLLFYGTSDSQGMLLAKDIRDRERGGRAEIKVIEGDSEKDSPQNMEILTGVLGQRTFNLVDGTSDETADQEQKGKLTLYQYASPESMLSNHSCYRSVRIHLCNVFFHSFQCVRCGWSDAGHRNCYQTTGPGSPEP